MKSTLFSEHNVWWNPSDAKPFTVPEPAYYTTLSWSQWKSETGQDSQSTFAAPSVDPTTPCQVAPDAMDFWFGNPDQGNLSTNAGTPITYTLIMIPVGGFAGQATLTQYGVNLIPGASGTFSATSIKQSGTVTFTVNTSKSTPAGSYPITLIAHSGNLTRTVSVWLNVE